jgi:hypothetical protein
MPTTVAVLGSGMADADCSMAQRLAKKTGKQIFVSCDLPTDPNILILAVEKRILREIV